VNPKKWLYDLHKNIPVSPDNMKWAIPAVTLPLAYMGHKWITDKVGSGVSSVGRSLGSQSVVNFGRNIRKDSSPKRFAAIAALASYAAAKGVYATEDTDPNRLKDWKSFFYGVDKQASLTTAAASLEQGWGDDALLGYHMKKLDWLTPSVNVRELKDTIWDTPGFTPGQKTFLRDSVDGAVEASGNPSLISRNDLGLGAQRAIVNHVDKVPSLLGIAAKSTALAAQGAMLGQLIGTVLGGSPATTTALAGTSAAASVIGDNDVMKEIGSVF
jgi:hypothetical protein